MNGKKIRIILTGLLAVVFVVSVGMMIRRGYRPRLSTIRNADLILVMKGRSQNDSS